MSFYFGSNDWDGHSDFDWNCHVQPSRDYYELIHGFDDLSEGMKMYYRIACQARIYCHAVSACFDEMVDVWRIIGGHTNTIRKYEVLCNMKALSHLENCHRTALKLRVSVLLNTPGIQTYPTENDEFPLGSPLYVYLGLDKEHRDALTSIGGWLFKVDKCISSLQKHVNANRATPDGSSDELDIPVLFLYAANCVDMWELKYAFDFLDLLEDNVLV